MRPLRLLLSGFLVLISYLSKHDGFSNVRFNAQHGESHCGFSDIQKGELVDNVDRAVWPILRWGCAPTRFAVQRPVGPEYCLRHLRTSAFGTRGQTGSSGTRPRTDLHERKGAERQFRPQHCLMRKDEQQQRQRKCRGSKQAIADLPTLRYVYGGGPKKRKPRNASFQYDSLFQSFCQRTQRIWVEEIPDGHCGIRSTWRQDTSRGEFASIDSEHIRKSREKLASGLRIHSSSIVNVIEIESTDPQEIEDRAKLHLHCCASKTCDSS